jgi:hypothetical protein
MRCWPMSKSDHSRHLRVIRMSALAPRAIEKRTCQEVRFVPFAAVSRCSNNAFLFDYLVGTSRQRLRHVEVDALAILRTILSGASINAYHTTP